jgi:hypothetical protein
MLHLRVVAFCVLCVAVTVFSSGCSDSTDAPEVDMGNWVGVGDVEWDVFGPVCSELEKEDLDYAMDSSGGRPTISVPPDNVEAAKKILARHAQGK